MRKLLQFTIFICLFTANNLFAQCDFNYTEFPVGAPHCEGISLIFTGTGPAGTIDWSWDFGPGAQPQTSSLQNPPPVYFPICNPNQQVTLTTNNGSCTHTETVPIYCKPVACFTPNFPSACAGTQFCFNSSCSTPGLGSGILIYQWDMNNGQQLNAPNPCYTYPSGDTGCFTVKLFVTNEHGCTDFLQMNNAVCIAAPPVFQISALTPTSTCQTTLTVDYCCTPVTGGSGGYSYSWTFPGGTPSTSNVACPTGIVYSTGQYSVTCVVTDLSGCATTHSIPNFINVGNSSTSIILSNDSVCVGQTVQVSTGIATGYQWTITAGGPPAMPSSTVQNISYTFLTAGTYVITLNDSVNGCHVSATATVHVFNKPVACINITSNPPSCSVPQTINVNYCGPPTVPGYQYKWTFAGGTPAQYIGTSVNPNPPNGGAVTYTACGHYSVSLTVIGFAGCDSTITLLDVVIIDCPVACYAISNMPIEGQFCAPLTLDFDANCSTGIPTQYLWCVSPVGAPPCTPVNLGPTPSLTFPSAGCYNVTLKIINAAGCTATIMNSFPGTPICVGEHSAPCFTPNPIETCAPVSVLFTNCTLDTAGNIGGTEWLPCHTWCWNFENGTACQSSALNPQHLYSDTGMFEITLISKNCGCYDTTYFDSVHIMAPIPHFTDSVNCASPNMVFYNGTSSIGADHYYWTFVGGNPSTSTDSIVTVVYPMPNPTSNPIAMLKVCNDQSGCCDSIGMFVPLASLQAIATVDTVVCYPETSAVTNNSIGAYSYVWRGFDACNNMLQLGALNSTARSWSLPANSNTGAITWPGPGKYRMRLRIISNSSCEDTLIWDVKVYGVQPQFYGDSLSGCAPFSVTFTDTTNANCVSIPVSHRFTFGDNTPASPWVAVGINVSHIYTTNGTFSVTDSVKDNHGCISVFTIQNYINAQTPTVDFNVPDTTICLGTPMCFNNTSTGTGLQYVWDFGDNTDTTVAFPCHTYANSGTYTVQLSAIDIHGCVDTMKKVNYIVVGNVNVDFYATNVLKSCPVLLDTFYVVPPIPNACAQYYWSFGDGSYSTIDTPFHIYGYSGSFTVSLLATDLCLGCSTTITKVNYINLGGPFSTPVATPDTTCSPQQICFNLNPTNAETFLWDFNDGSAQISGPNLTALCHTYTDTGIFIPSVVLTDSSNTCTYQRFIDTLIITQPLPKFTSSTNDLCSNGIVTFTDQSWSFGGINNLGNHVSHIVNWLWDFGDFTTSSLQNPPPHAYNTFGDFYVTLTITSVGGCTATARDTIHVTQAPTALPVFPPTACIGICVPFTADTSNSSTVCSVHWDFGDAGINSDTSNLLNPCYAYNTPGIYPVTIIVYGCNGCNDTAFTSVTIGAPPLADAGPDITICIHDTALLVGTGGSIYHWTDLFLISLSDSLNDSTFAYPPASTTYTLVVTDLVGCKDTDMVSVSITPPPVAGITPGDSICPGTPFQITASGGTSYLWSTGDTTSTITVAPFTDTVYTVMAFIGQCGDDTSVAIYVLPLPPVDAGDSTAFCFGLSTQLNGTSTTNIYLWTPPGTLSEDTVLNPIASPTITTTYTLTVTDSIGCKNSDTVIITVHPLPIVNAGPDKKICSGTYTQLNATGAIFYAWSPSTGLLNDSIPNPICGPTDTTVYILTGADVNGCQGIDSIKILVLFPFTVIYPNDTCLCQGETAALCAISSTQSTFQWKPVYGLDSSTNSCVNVTPANSVTYTIYVSDSLGCYADTGDVVVCLFPPPSVLAGPDQTILVGTTAQLSGYNITNPGTGTYSWIPDSTLTCYACENPIANPLQTTIYVVTLSDLNGCKDEDTTLINVYCNDNVLYVPNAFTPNGDGKNDEFHLDGVGISELNFLRIYNRWGQLVFETNSLSGKWDGKINGKKSEPEVFDYFLEAVCSTGQLIRKQGNITLIR